MSGGKMGMKPDLVARLEVGDLSDGQGTVATGDANINLGAIKIKTRLRDGLAVGECAGQDRAEANPDTETRPRHYYLY